MSAHPPAITHLQRGIGLHNAGNFAAAEACYRQALTLDVGNRDGLHLLALSLHLQGRDTEARAFAQRAVEGAARVPGTFYNTLGEIERVLGEPAAAESCFLRALEINPGDHDALNNLGIVLESRQDHDGALARFEAAYRHSPTVVIAGNLGRALLRAHRIDAANEVFSALLPQLDAPFPEEVFRGVVDALIELRRRAGALRAAECWRRHWPASRRAKYAQARGLSLRHRETEALEIFLELLDEGGAGAALRHEIGRCLHFSGEPDKALAYYQNACELEPTHAAARTARAVLWIEEGQVEAGLAELRHLADAHPDDSVFAFNRAFYLLLTGAYAEGWHYYEQRDRLKDVIARSAGVATPWPLWDGGPCDGKTVLVRAEQGLGDVIHFARFAVELDRRGARVVLETPPVLVRLVAQMLPFARVQSPGEVVPEIDLQCGLMSLPRLLGLLDSHSLFAEHLLVAPAVPAADRQRWAERLSASGAQGKRIGLCWAGSTLHENDAWRSCPAAALNLFADLPGTSFVSLQRDRRDEGMPDLPGMIDVTAELTDLADTAALIAGLDLVITVDTAIAHLAGVVGVPTWLMVTRNGDWRWGLGSDKTPWYPQMRLFRQPRLGDWQPVLSEILTALGETDRAEREPGEAGECPASAPPQALPPQVLAQGQNYLLLNARYGRMLANRNDRYVGRSLIEYGEFSEEELAVMLDSLPPGGVVVEAGANIGALTLPLARHVGPAGRIIALEPQRLLFQMLCANLALNEIVNADVRCAAFGAHAGEIAMPEFAPSAVENFGGLSAGQGSATVPLLTVDSLALPRVNLIKADVEGMEKAVLDGAADTIGRCRPVLYVENDRRDQSAALIATIQSLGYRLYWHTPPLYSADNFFANTVNHFPGLVSGNVLCFPQEAEVACNLTPVLGPDDWPEGK